MTTTQIGARLFSYGVIADTHLNQDEMECNSPFEVNQLANVRLRWVIEDLNSRELSHVIHLGDVVHPVPSMGDLYSNSATRFKEQVAPLKHPLFIIPGNHDVGDKPIKWGPAGTVRQSFLDAWEQHFAPHYFKHQHQGMVFIGINAQVLGSNLALEAEQDRWLESTLQQHAGDRLCLFTHYPPFLLEPDEDEHYDNIGLAGRDRILGLLEQYNVEALFAGHVHHFWYNRYQNCDCFLLPSTCFTRQDYSEMFRIGPAEENGRNDADKLGYFLVHVHAQGQVVEMVRSHGRSTAPGAQPPVPLHRIEPVNARTNNSPVMGFDLRHDWCERVQIPPSGGLDEFDRKWVRNDYGLLALWEMGVRNLRVPAIDLLSPERRQRLSNLAQLGFRFNLYSFGQSKPALLSQIHQCREVFDSWEIGFHPDDLEQLNSGLQASPELLDCRSGGLKLFASPLRSKDDILSSGKKYYHVINHGFTNQDRNADGEFYSELLDQSVFSQLFDGVVMRCGLDDDIQALLELARSAKSSQDLDTTLHLRLTADHPGEYQQSDQIICNRLAEAMMYGRSSPEVRIYCDSFTDNDRGYFPRRGVLDRRYNPRPGFHLVKTLHGMFNVFDEPDSINVEQLVHADRIINATSSSGKISVLLAGTSSIKSAAEHFGRKQKNGGWIDWKTSSCDADLESLDQDLPMIFGSRHDV